MAIETFVNSVRWSLKKLFNRYPDDQVTNTIELAEALGRTACLGLAAFFHRLKDTCSDQEEILVCLRLYLTSAEEQQHPCDMLPQPPQVFPATCLEEPDSVERSKRVGDLCVERAAKFLKILMCCADPTFQMAISQAARSAQCYNRASQAHASEAVPQDRNDGMLKHHLHWSEAW